MSDAQVCHLVLKLVKPPRLHRGYSVGVFSPSWPVTETACQKFDQGIQKLQSMELNVRIAEHTLDQYYHRSCTREERLANLYTFWEDPEVRMVLMVA